MFLDRKTQNSFTIKFTIKYCIYDETWVKLNRISEFNFKCDTLYGANKLIRRFLSLSKRTFKFKKLILYKHKSNKIYLMTVK